MCRHGPFLQLRGGPKAPVLDNWPKSQTAKMARKGQYRVSFPETSENLGGPIVGLDEALMRAGMTKPKELAWAREP